MKQPSTTVIALPVSTRTLAHDDIAQCAKDLWVEYGRPIGRDDAIWLEAETRLLCATRNERDRTCSDDSLSAERADLDVLRTRLELKNDDEHR